MKHHSPRQRFELYQVLSKAYITIAIRLRYDYDEKLTFIFFAGVEWKQVCDMS